MLFIGLISFQTIYALLSQISKCRKLSVLCRIFLPCMHGSWGIRRILEVPKLESSFWGTMLWKCKNQQFHYLQACTIAVPICIEIYASHRGNRFDADCVGSIVAQVPLPPSPIPLSGHISGFWAAHWNWKELLRTQLDCARHRGGWSRQGGSGRRKVANPHLLHFIYFVFTFAMNKLMFHGCERSLQFFCLRFVNGILRNCCKID